MRFPLPNSRRQWINLGIIAPTLTVMFLISGFFQWSALHCWHDDVDINTGRVRHTRYLLFCKIGDRIEDTWLSRVRINSNTSPDWRRVNTFSPGVGYSPHYRFHGALHQIVTLELADKTVPFNPDARRKVSNTLLALLKNDSSDFDADEFVKKVVQTAFALHDSGASVVMASEVPAG